MKNKSVEKNKKSHSEIEGVTKPHQNIKNRNQLRKKLKGLLEKQVAPSIKSFAMQQSNKIQVPSPTQSNSYSPKNEKFQKSLKTEDPKTAKAKKLPNSNSHNGKNLGPKTPAQSEPSKKKKKKVASKNVNTNPDEMSRKRKLEQEKKAKPNKQPEIPKVLSNKKQKLLNGKPPKTKVVADPGEVNGQSKLSKSNVGQKSSKQIKNKLKLEKKKLKKKEKVAPPSPPAELNAKTKLASKKKLKKNQYVQGRGPLCPPSSDSEVDAEIEQSPHHLTNTNDQNGAASSECESSPNDVSLQNSPDIKKALVRASDEVESCCSDSDEGVDYSSQDQYSDEEEEEHSDEEYDSEYEENSSEEDEFMDYSDDESWNTDASYEYSNDSDDVVNGYFDTDDDDDSYVPSDYCPDDIYIAQGTAVKHDLTNEDIGFDSDPQSADKLQIIELPSKLPETEKISPQATTLPLANDNNNKSTEVNTAMPDSDDSCPELVPITNTPQYNKDGYDDSDDDSGTFDSGMSPIPYASSHSCNSICSCVEDFESVTSEEYDPMVPEIIRSKEKDVPQEIENIFDSAIDPQDRENPDSLLEEMQNTETNPRNYIVYTTHNKTVNYNSISQSKTLQNVVDETIERSLKRTKESEKPKESDESSAIRMFDEQQAMTTANCDPHTSSSMNASHEDANRTPIHPETEYLSTPNKKQKLQEPKLEIQTLFFNAINSNHVLVLLKDPLYIYGTVKLKLLAGSMNIFGYSPNRNEVLEIFSPRGYSSLKIEPSPSINCAPLNEKDILSLTPFFIRSDLEEVLNKFDSLKDAIAILERNDRSKKVSMLRKYMAEHLFPNMNSILSDRTFYTSEFLLRCIITPQSDNPLVINPDWNSIPIRNDSKLLIIGGKSVGKSTLVRYLINRHLIEHPKILLIDLDIGQPEIFVPQTISATTLTQPLLGPGYFLTKQPDKSFVVGDISIVQSLEPYLESLKALCEFCNKNSEYKNIPWIVNTMGYNKGFGDELVSVICSLLKPSNIIQFDSHREINNFDVIMTKQNVKSIERNIIDDSPYEELNPQHQLTLMKPLVPKSNNPNNEWNMKPREMRLAMILTRLSCILIDNAEWLTDVKPLSACIDDLTIVKIGEDKIDKEDLVKTLVGNIVYLCRMESTKTLECFGIGIVRAIDFPSRQIYLLPSVEHRLLQNVNCLAVCGIPLQSSILLNQGPKVKGTASYVYNTLDEASSMYVKQMFNKPKPYAAN